MFILCTSANTVCLFVCGSYSCQYIPKQEMWQWNMLCVHLFVIGVTIQEGGGGEGE